MKIATLHAPSAQTPDLRASTQEAQAKSQAGAVDGKGAIDPEKLRLAKEFEQIFIRKMLSSLEKSGRSMAGASASSGGDAYGSMVVSALAEAVSKGGGIGLAEVIARAASNEAQAAAATSPAAAAGNVAESTAAARTNAANDSGSSAMKIAVPHQVHITTSPSATYPRPVPAIILNQNHDIEESFKDRNR